MFYSNKIKKTNQVQYLSNTDVQLTVRINRIHIVLDGCRLFFTQPNKPIL
jgi:hypothetical protein